MVIEFGLPQAIDAIQISWANPYATRYVVEYWTGKEDALNKPTDGLWAQFPYGSVTGGRATAKFRGSRITRDRAFCAYDDGIVEYLRHATEATIRVIVWAMPSARSPPGNYNSQGAVHRSGSALSQPSADHHAGFFPRSLA